MQSEAQTASSTVWTRLVKPISYGNNNYFICASFIGQSQLENGV